ncbi:MAG: MFS transporter [Bifidobacteriaceae bacterium]|nr:MFS transporter [Bifidobacteriaceae bacterium]
MGRLFRVGRVTVGGERWKRAVALFLGGQAVSLFGSALVQYAVIWWVALDSGSGWTYTLAVLAAMLPTGVFSIFGGVWADRHSRKALVIGADAGIALVTGALAVAVLVGEPNLGVILVALGLRGVGGGIQMPAVTAMIPQIVPEQHLMRVNALAGTIQSGVFIVSPAAAAGLLASVDLGWIFLIDVGTAALAIAALSLLAVPRIGRAGETGSAAAGPAQEQDRAQERARARARAAGEHGRARAHVGREMRVAVRYAWADRAVRRVLVGYTVMFLLVVPPANLAPIVVVRLFNSSLVELSSLEIVWSLGAVIGGAILAAWGGLRNRMTMILIVAALWGLFTVVLGLAPNFWVFVVIMAVFGITMPGLATPATTALQERVAPDFQGRVFGLLNIVMMMSAPVGMAVVGPLADVVSVRTIYVVTGIVTIVAAGLLSIRAPRLDAPAAAPATGGERTSAEIGPDGGVRRDEDGGI